MNEEFIFDPIGDLKKAGINEGDIDLYASMANDIISPASCVDKDGKVDINLAIRKIDLLEDERLRSFILITAFITMFSTGMLLKNIEEKIDASASPSEANLN